TSLLEEMEAHLTPLELRTSTPCNDFGKHVLMGIAGRVPHLGFLARHKGNLYGYEPGKPWYDVGNKRDYLAVNATVLDGQIDVPLPYARYPWGWLGDDVDIDFARTTVRAPVIIGSGCRIAPGAEIGPHAVLGDGWTLGRGAKVRNAVLWPRSAFV